MDAVMTRGPLLKVEHGMRGIERSVSFRPRPGRAVPPARVAPAPGADWNATELHDLEAQLLAALNAERVKAGRTPLATNPHVQASISFYCLESAEFQFLSHDSPDVGDARWPAMPWAQRLLLFGSPSTAALGENLAYGFLDVASVVAAWMSDIGHRDNILGSAWAGVGCGVARWPGNGQPQTNPDGTPNNSYRGPLIWWGNDFTSEQTGPTPQPPPVPPPPPPPAPGPTPIVKGAIWRNKTSHTQRVQITRDAAPTDAKVYYRIIRSGADRHMLQTLFRQAFEVSS